MRWFRQPTEESPEAAAAEEPPVLFIHVMRTGGTSLRQMLWGAYDQADIYPSQADLDGNNGNYPEIPGVVQELQRRVSTPPLVQGHLPYVIRDLFPSDTRIVTVLRDPIARSISTLRRMRRRRQNLGGMTLDEVLEIDALREPMITNYQTKVFSFRHLHELESVNHPLSLQPWRLELALENLADCAMVGTTERFSEIGPMLDELSIPHGEPIHTNTARESDPEASPQLVERLREAVALDIQLYDALPHGAGE